jgi:hypothetical protein
MTEGEDQIRAQYLATRCVELVQQAERSGFKTGAYLLKMACLEFIEQQDHLGKTPRARLDRAAIIHGPVVAVIKAAKRFC